MMRINDLKNLIQGTLNIYSKYFGGLDSSFCNKNAFNQVYGTIILESKRGEFRRQKTKHWNYNVHALGIPQIEKNTFDWLHGIYADRIPEIRNIQFIDLAYNDEIAILFCRLRYLRVRKPLPETLLEQANYWKKYYNASVHGLTAQNYIEYWEKYS